MSPKQPISTHIQENESYIRRRLAGCDDIIIRPMLLGEDKKLRCVVVYIEVAVSNMMLNDSVIGKLINNMWEMPQEEIRRYVEDNSLGISDVKNLYDMEKAFTAMLAGNAIFFLDGYPYAIKISSKGYPNLSVQTAEREQVLRGSREGFSDAVKSNSALVRKRLRTSKLKVKQLETGVRSHTVLNLLYIEDLADEEFLEEIQNRLESFEIDGVTDSGILEQLTEEVWYSPFPQFQTTERPDKVAMELLNGRVALLCDNTPVALLLPTTYNNFLQVTEDWYNRFEMASLIRFLRYVAVGITMLLPGLYLAVTDFHTQVLPTNLILSFAEARQGVPFPSMLEILLMELAFELIREAGVRTPGPLGGTIGIVGGLIVGQAAVEANLASPMVVVVVAITALCSLAIPNEEFSAAFRLLKYGFVILGGSLGIYGIALGVYLVLSHLSGLLSFGIPYLMPFVVTSYTRNKEVKDGIFRAPIWTLRSRPIYANPKERIRLRRKEK